MIIMAGGGLFTSCTKKWTIKVEANNDDLHSIRYALTSLGIDEPLYPSWLPNDMARTEYVFEEKPFFLHEAYSGNDRFLSITISPITGSETAVYQKEGSNPEEFSINNTVFFIFENTNEITAVWYTDGYTVSIVGNISMDETKKVLSSVYEVKR